MAIPNPKRREFREGSRTQERRGTPCVLAPGERKIKPGEAREEGGEGIFNSNNSHPKRLYYP